MSDWVVAVVAFVEPWWPLIAKIGTMWLLGQYFKKRVWTKAAALNSGFHRRMRRSMPLHPLVLGVAWGAAWPYLPASAIVETQGGAVTEGIIAWLFSVGGYMILEKTAEWNVKRNPDSKWQIVLNVLRDVISDRETKTPPPKTPEPPN